MVQVHPEVLTKADRKLLHDAWTRFDRSTALGCAQRRERYDAARCRELWGAYMALGEARGIPRAQSPFNDC